jgi:hypothetical protein
MRLRVPPVGASLGHGRTAARVLQAGSKWRGDGSGVTPPMSCAGGSISDPQELKVMLATAKVAATTKVRAVVMVFMVSSLLE